MFDDGSDGQRGRDAGQGVSLSYLGALGWTFGISGLTALIAVLASGLRPFANARFQYVGKSISDVIDNVDIRYQSSNPTLGYAAAIPVTYNGVLVSPGDVIAPLPVSQPLAAYTLLGASFGVGRDGWRMEVYGDNLTNKRPELYKSANDGENRTTTSRPRTIGLRFSYKM